MVYWWLMKILIIIMNCTHRFKFQFYFQINHKIEDWRNMLFLMYNYI